MLKKRQHPLYYISKKIRETDTILRIKTEELDVLHNGMSFQHTRQTCVFIIQPSGNVV